MPLPISAWRRRRRSPRRLSAPTGRAGTWAFDVSDRPAVEQAADQIEKQLGPIDIWVNNAGISHIVPFLECSEELWDQTLRINLRGAFIGCQAAIRRMLPRRQGVVLNMSSQSGKVGNSHYAAYCASKFGIIGLTQSLAVEFAGDRNPSECPVPWYRDDTALGPDVGRLCTQAKPEARRRSSLPGKKNSPGKALHAGRCCPNCRLSCKRRIRLSDGASPQRFRWNGHALRRGRVS